MGKEGRVLRDMVKGAPNRRSRSVLALTPSRVHPHQHIHTHRVTHTNTTTCIYTQKIINTSRTHIQTLTRTHTQNK